MPKKELRVLVACEYSGTVRDAFTRLGHYAMSVDLLPTESTGNHYQGSVFDVLNGSWDLMIAHPPCTFLSRAANRVWNTPGRKEKREQALEFFKKLYYAPIPRICIENPLGYVSEVFIKYDQIIHPYYFGDQEMKRTCLWLRNLPPLIHATEDELFYKKSHTSKPQPFGFTTSGKAKYFMDKCKGGGDLRRKNRAKFWPGIAEAMAMQWGGDARSDKRSSTLLTHLDPKPSPSPSITNYSEDKKKISEIRGKYSHIKSSSEDFLKEKHSEGE